MLPVVPARTREADFADFPECRGDPAYKIRAERSSHGSCRSRRALELMDATVPEEAVPSHEGCPPRDFWASCCGSEASSPWFASPG